jgi:hypothetical protein
LEAAVALAPKCITLDREERSLSAVLQEIEKQTGYKLMADDAGDQKFYRLEMKKVAFWEALERIGRETGRVVQVERSEDSLQMVRREGHARFVVVDGAFRLEVTRIHEDRDIDFTQMGEDKKPGRRDHRLTLDVAVNAEPKFTLLSIGRPRVEAALDEDEKALRPLPALEERVPDHAGIRRDLFHPMSLSQTAIVLQRSNEQAKTIKALRGTVPVKVVVERKSVVVTKNVLESKGTKFDIAGDTLEITDAVQLKAGHYYVSIAVPPELDERQAHWFERVQLEDVNGIRYESRSLGTSTGGTKKEINFLYDQSANPKLGPPCRLVFEDWVVLHYAIPFGFTDVPLP